jgi:hypothetical protein
VDILETHEDIEVKMRTHFQYILSEPPMERETTIKSISRNIPSLVIDEHNPSIMWATTFEEVTQTM